MHQQARGRPQQPSQASGVQRQERIHQVPPRDGHTIGLERAMVAIDWPVARSFKVLVGKVTFCGADTPPVRILSVLHPKALQAHSCPRQHDQSSSWFFSWRRKKFISPLFPVRSPPEGKPFPMRAMYSTSMLLYAALLTVAAVRTSSASLPELRARGAGPSMRGRFAAFASGFSHGRPLALTGSTRSLCSRTASLSTSGAYAVAAPWRRPLRRSARCFLFPPADPVLRCQNLARRCLALRPACGRVPFRPTASVVLCC